MSRQTDATAIHEAGLRHRFVHQKGIGKAPVVCELLNKNGEMVGSGDGPSEELALSAAADIVRTQGRPKTKDEIIAEQSARIRALESDKREPPPSTAAPPGDAKPVAKDLKKQELTDLLTSNNIEIAEDMKVDELRIVATEQGLAV